MSTHVLSAVWKLNFGDASRKLVAVAIADMANDEGFTWPSLRSLARRCDLSEDSIRRHIRALTDDGILTVEPRFAGGRQTSNAYTFNSETIRARLAQVQGGAGTDARGEGGMGARGEGGMGASGVNHQKEPLEGSGRKAPQPRFIKPSLDEVKAYAAERAKLNGSANTEAEAFHDYQEAKGWKIGTAPMKDWRAAWRTWERNAIRFAEEKQPGNGRVQTGIDKRSAAQRAREMGIG